MSFTFRPAKRENTPLIVGLAGPTKSGKTFSAHRLAVGLAQGAPVAMINAEGAKGHQYSDRFTYLFVDLEAPYRPAKYTEALKAALALKPRPAVVIIDSLSHMHDGPGGVLEYHETELDRLAGNDYKKRERSTWTAWIKPKADENQFIYTMLSADCHLILCFRAKEKLKIVKGKDPIDLGWQPIAGERVAFETIFTLVLPPHSKGVPDLSLSEMREPFDTIVPQGPLSEATGTALARWATGGANGRVDDAEVAAITAEISGLEQRILAFAPSQQKRDATEALFGRQRAFFATDRGAYIAWLGAQLENTQAKAAELTPSQVDMFSDTATPAKEGEPA
jgi:hypothetical protein